MCVYVCVGGGRVGGGGGSYRSRDDNIRPCGMTESLWETGCHLVVPIVRAAGVVW